MLNGTENLELGKTSLLDANGYRTGEDKINYSEPVMIMANVAPAASRTLSATGRATREMYGVNLNCDNTIITEIDDGFDLLTVWYIDKEPTKVGEDWDGYDYLTTKVDRSLNHLSIDVKRVEVT